MPRVQINSRNPIDRLRTYLGVKGPVEPQLDDVVSPTCLLQDLSSIQGRGTPFGMVTSAVPAGTQLQHFWLYNDPTFSRGQRMIWVQDVELLLEAVPDSGTNVSYGYVQGDVPGSGATLVAEAATRDLRFQNAYVTGTQEFAARGYADTGAGPFPLITLWTIGAPPRGTAGRIYHWQEPQAGIFLLPGWAAEVRVEPAAAGDRMDVSWVGREFEFGANPRSP